MDSLVGVDSKVYAEPVEVEQHWSDVLMGELWVRTHAAVLDIL